MPRDSLDPQWSEMTSKEEVQEALIERFFDKFAVKRSEGKLDESYDNDDVKLGHLLVRYIANVQDQVADILDDVDTEDCAMPQTEQRKLQRKDKRVDQGGDSHISPQQLKKKVGVYLTNHSKGISPQVPLITYDTMRKLYSFFWDMIENNKEYYNTEDGQIRFLHDKGYTDIHLAKFWSAIPQEVKAEMMEWKYMSSPLQRAIELRNKLWDIPPEYNTEDGQIRFLHDSGYTEINLAQFWSVIPQEVTAKMTEWNKMSFPLQKAIELRNKLFDIPPEYNTEDGQIRFLHDKGYTDINLAKFWSIIPQEVKAKMTEWKRINFPLQRAIELREKLFDIPPEYNTQDGQIRFLHDNGYTDIHLAKFWSVIPQEVKAKMTEWKMINLPFATAYEYMSKLPNMRAIIRKNLHSYVSKNDYIERVLTLFLSRVCDTPQQAQEYVSQALQGKEYFFMDLCLSDICVTSYEDVYQWAESDKWYDRVLVYLMIKIQWRNITGIKRIVQTWELGWWRDAVSLDGSCSHDDACSLYDKVEDDSVPAPDTPDKHTLFETIMTECEKRGIELWESALSVLYHATQGDDMSDDDMHILATEIQKHPDLIELLSEYLNLYS